MTEEQYQDFLRRHPKCSPDRVLQIVDRSAQAKGVKRPKYGNRKVTDVNGDVHDSKREYRRWCDLQLRERAGEITQLRRQVVFDLVVNGVLVCKYVADAVYVENDAEVVEDTKGVSTAVFRLKAKLMRAIYGIEIQTRA